MRKEQLLGSFSTSLKVLDVGFGVEGLVGDLLVNNESRSVHKSRYMDNKVGRLSKSRGTKSGVLFWEFWNYTTHILAGP